ncbi:MAG: hypothetical protein AB8B55_05140 [Mariniblastus sp.]
MDDRFKNLIAKRDSRLGWVFLATLVVLMLTVNRFIYETISGASSPQKAWLPFLMGGVVAGEFSLLAVWAALGHQSLIRRLLFLASSTFALFSAWLLGYTATFSQEVGMNWQHREELYTCGIIPLLLMAISVPLFGLRLFFKRVIAPEHESAPSNSPITISSLLLATAVVALVVFLANLGAPETIPPNDFLKFIGLPSGIFFLCGLVIVVPTVLLTLDTRRSFFVWAFVMLLTTVTLNFGITMVLTTFVDPKIELQDSFPLLLLTSSAMVVFLIGIATIRLFGFRLVKMATS